MAPRSDQELLLRIDAAAERLAVSRATLYRLLQRGELPTVRIGSAVRVPVSAIERWLADQLTSQGGGLWFKRSRTNALAQRRTTGSASSRSLSVWIGGHGSGVRFKSPRKNPPPRPRTTNPSRSPTVRRTSSTDGRAVGRAGSATGGAQLRWRPGARTSSSWACRMCRAQYRARVFTGIAGD